MKIAILGPVHTLALKPYIRNCSSIPPGMGGYSLTNLIVERIKRGLETEVITLDPLAKKHIQMWEGEKIRLWIVQRRRNRLIRDLYKRERLLMQKVLDIIKPDICHANWTYEYGLATITQQNIPTILTVHDHTLNILRNVGLIYLPQFFVTCYVIAKSKYITTVSPYVAMMLEKVYRKKVYVIPNVLPEFIWKIKRNVIVKNTVIIFSSLIIAHFKNFYNALRSFHIVQKYFSNKGITILYKISGIKENDIPKSWMKGHELFKNIYLLGKLPYYENIMEMSKSDILFHPSLEEALPGPILEGMALNKPVIAAEEAGGSRWLLDNGKYGILTKGKSVKIMSEDLIALVDKIIEGRYDASIAYEWIRDICDPNIIIEQYEQTYKLAIKNCNSNHI